MRSSRRDVRGSVSVLVAAFVVTTLLLCTAVARLGGAAAERSRADAAADASALAAAGSLARGQPSLDACAIARRTATDNGARLLTCRSVTAPDGTMAADVALEIGAAHARSRAEVDAAGAGAP